MGGVQDRLTEVEVIGLTLGLPGAWGGPNTVSLAEDEADPPEGRLAIQVYTPSSTGQTSCIFSRHTFPELENDFSLERGLPLYSQSTVRPE